MNLFKRDSNLIHKIVGRFIIWETHHNGYYVTDRKQRFVMVYGSLDECQHFTDMHPYGMTLAEMKKMKVADI